MWRQRAGTGFLQNEPTDAEISQNQVIAMIYFRKNPGPSANCPNPLPYEGPMKPRNHPMRKFTLAILSAAAMLHAQDYPLGPDSQVQPGVPKGTVTRLKLEPGKFYRLGAVVRLPRDPNVEDR